jgi:hypothetical protein
MAIIDKKNTHTHTKKKASPPSSTASILPAPKTAELNEKNLQTEGKKKKQTNKIVKKKLK